MPEYTFSPDGSRTEDGRWMPVQWSGGIPEQRAICDDDIAELAGEFAVPAAHLDAVLDVETRGSGFLLNEPSPARPKILFEAHWFYKLTPLPVSKERPDLSSPHWDRSLYRGGSAEWDRLCDAMAFDPVQALKSASWGLGQVMGFNYSLAGCASLESFVAEAFTSEAAQVRHALNFCAAHGLVEALREGNWNGFARGYNGAAYKVNQYDVRLADAARTSRLA